MVGNSSMRAFDSDLGQHDHDTGVSMRRLIIASAPGKRY
jgi:hypothetical protein